MYNYQFGIYMNYPVTRYVELANGNIIRRDSIPDDEYEALKEWGEIIREFEGQDMDFVKERMRFSCQWY